MLDSNVHCMCHSTGADYLFIPERPPQSDDWESEMCEAIRKVGLLHSVVVWNLSPNAVNIFRVVRWESEKTSLLFLRAPLISI